MQRRIHTGGSGSSPTSAGYLKLTLSSKASSGKASDEGTTLAMQIPGDTQPRTPVLICDRNRRHRMGQFCQWRIERHFIAAEVILLAQRALCPYGRRDRKAVEWHAIPRSTLHVPGKDGLVSHQVHFAIGETLASVDIGTARFQIVAANLLSGCGKRKPKNCHQGTDRH